MFSDGLFLFFFGKLLKRFNHQRSKRLLQRLGKLQKKKFDRHLFKIGGSIVLLSFKMFGEQKDRRNRTTEGFGEVFHNCLTITLITIFNIRNITFRSIRKISKLLLRPTFLFSKKSDCMTNVHARNIMTWTIYFRLFCCIY